MAAGSETAPITVPITNEEIDNSPSVSESADGLEQDTCQQCMNFIDNILGSGEERDSYLRYLSTIEFGKNHLPNIYNLKSLPVKKSENIRNRRNRRSRSNRTKIKRGRTS